jgi:hypothetical protein
VTTTQENVALIRERAEENRYAAEKLAGFLDWLDALLRHEDVGPGLTTTAKQKLLLRYDALRAASVDAAGALPEQIEEEAV